MDESTPPPIQEAPPSFRWILLVLGAISTALGFPGFWWSECSYLFPFVWFGVGFLFLSLLETRIPSNLFLLLTASCLGLWIGSLLSAPFHIDPYLYLRNQVLALSAPKVGIWRFDPLYGYSHVPNSSGVQETPEYHVTYHIDGEGCRVTPDPLDPQGVVLCLGCSFTFGTGVEDEEAYPGQLAIRYWPQYKVKNAAVAGWGTAHAFLMVQEALSRKTVPVLVMYGWMFDHLHRNWIRKGWIQNLQSRMISIGSSSSPLNWRKHPHFEIVGGRLLYEGVIGPGEAPEETAETIVKEVALTQQMVAEMASLCASRNVPFVFITLPTEEGEPPVPDYLVEVLLAKGVWHVDATQAGRGFFANDYHPDATTHAAIADVIAGDERIEEWLGHPVRSSRFSVSVQPEG